MSDKIIKISPPEGYEIDKDKSTFEEIVFKKKGSKHPMKWEELKSVSGFYISSDANVFPSFYIGNFQKNVFPTKKEAEAMLAMAQLCQLRDVWNEGWKPDWSKSSPKYVIEVLEYHLSSETYIHTRHPMAFKSAELRDRFLETFRDLLETAKPFL